MKRLFAVGILMMLLNAVAFGQMDSKVTTGVVAYQQGDYEKAIKALNIALENPSALKEKNRSKAYYYRAKTSIMLMGKYAREKNETMLLKYKDAPMNAYKDYKLCKENDSYEKWGKKVDAELSTMLNPMLQGGLGFLNQGSKEKDGPSKKAIFENGLEYLTAATEINTIYYVTYDLRAQTYMGLKDTTAALADFKMAAKLFNENKPASPDVLIGYVYYRMALLYRYKYNDLDKALEMVVEGAALIDSEFKRYEEKKADLSADQWSRIEGQHHDAKKDLGSFELDIYLNFPDKREEALAKFEKAVVENPDDYIIHLAYASLLEELDRDKSIEMYKKAIEISPEEEHAYFNLGALYNNVAKELYDAANDEEDYEKSGKLQEKVDETFKMALPMFEKAYELNPTGLAAIRALKQITIRLNMMDDYARYKEIEKTLTGG